MIVREARPEDVPSLARVHVETWEATYRGLLPDALINSFTVEKRIAQWTEWLGSAENPVHSFAAAEADGTIIGFASAGTARAGCGFDGELFGLYVHPRAHRCGAGRALTSAAACYLAAAGCRSMVVWVLAGNPACGFYERLGGRLVAREQRDLYGFKVDEVAYAWDCLEQLLR